MIRLRYCVVQDIIMIRTSTRWSTPPHMYLLGARDEEVTSKTSVSMSATVQQ